MQTLRFHHTGNPTEALRLESLELPPPGEGEVRLRILAAPVNPADLNFIEGTYGVKPTLPAVPGIEGCGEVVTSRSPDFLPGDRAILLRRAGSWATHVQVPAETLFKLPEGLDPLQAAMLKVNPATAWRLLRGFGTPDPGSWIVQNAANSGVGRCVIAVARAMGVRTLNLVRRADLRDELLALGADEVVTDDEAGLDAAKAAFKGQPPRWAFNAVGGESALRLMNLLGPSGVHITYGAMARRPLTVPNGLLIFKDLQIRGLWVSRWIEQAPKDEIDLAYTTLAEMMRQGDLTVPVDATFPLEDFPAALAAVGRPGRTGKVLLVP